MKILIAEDDYATTKLYEIGFKEDEITTCINGEDFVMAYSDDYDEFILDIKMPIKNGFEVLDFLKGINNKIPIVFVTAALEMVTPIDREKLKEHLIIQKPILTSELRNKILKYIKTCAN